MLGLFWRKAVTEMPHVPARDAQVSPGWAVTVRVQVAEVRGIKERSEAAASARRRLGKTIVDEFWLQTVAMIMTESSEQ
jgi:hypothetical protein